jgi:molybdopterin/thiamine biosynthesis adenylyltransferase
MIQRSAPARAQLLTPKLPDNTNIKLIGLGGVGSIVARYLTIFLASLDQRARVVLIDGDSFELTNAHRMLFATCGNKAAVMHQELLACFENSAVTLDFIEEYITAENISRLIHAGDIILLTVDNHATRKLVNDYCGTLGDVCLVSGGNDGVEKTVAGRQLRGTFGNVQIYLRATGQELTPSLARFHPEIAQPVDQHPADKSCTELLVSVPQILFANLTVAAAMLNTLWLHLCAATHYSELAFDIADGLMRPTLGVENVKA